MEKWGEREKSDKVRKISGAQVKSKFYNGQSKRSYLREEEIRETIPFLKKPRRKGIVCMFPSEKNAHWAYDSVITLSAVMANFVTTVKN